MNGLAIGLAAAVIAAAAGAAPAPLRISGTVPTGKHPGGVVLAGGSLWVTNDVDNTVLENRPGEERGRRHHQAPRRTLSRPDVRNGGKRRALGGRAHDRDGLEAGSRHRQRDGDPHGSGCCGPDRVRCRIGVGGELRPVQVLQRPVLLTTRPARPSLRQGHGHVRGGFRHRARLRVRLSLDRRPSLLEGVPVRSSGGQGRPRDPRPRRARGDHGGTGTGRCRPRGGVGLAASPGRRHPDRSPHEHDRGAHPLSPRCGPLQPCRRGRVDVGSRPEAAFPDRPEVQPGDRVDPGRKASRQRLPRAPQHRGRRRRSLGNRRGCEHRRPDRPRS